MISIQNISKTFTLKSKTFKALDQVNMEIAEGDIVGIIGSSGAGKSTLIRCINLLEKPDNGAIVVRGRDLTKLNASELAAERKKIGMIFQHFNLLSSRTVFENVALPLELDKANKTHIQAKVTELLKIVGLEHKADEYPKNLSGGQKQRVAIARALANDPHLLLCDEATSALDPITTQSILQLLRDINQRLRITVLLITHEMEVVKAICNHVAVIDHGQLVAKGTLENILFNNSHPIIRQFLNTKNMTIPSDFNKTLQSQQNDGLFPLVEIELNGRVAFEDLVDTIYHHYKVPYKIIRAEIEYIGKKNFGKALLQLQGNADHNADVINYFNQHKIYNSVRGYA
ncbi:D-methionine transport system ATP-binding protein [Flexibacter flexilis DSM 6793]|uniref:Cell division ATP-binding protein FtsE n=1 Tax=Flexibacter flexilis DSM 6793 TaxID=927664 RepID=A0A1I1EE68_9BACT|nr:ATP-binding cassette domain-containing protein [Flexibacter flexilis]SFB83213.1 D-methionine transport system ATP-binding protein [Flexibacter flexilis DSM 6793]